MLNKALLEGENPLTYAIHCFKCQNICHILNSFNLNKSYCGFKKLLILTALFYKYTSENHIFLFPTEKLIKYSILLLYDIMTLISCIYVGAGVSQWKE